MSPRVVRRLLEIEGYHLRQSAGTSMLFRAEKGYLLDDLRNDYPLPTF